MVDKQPGLIRRFFKGIWAGFIFTRSLVLNGLFLVLLLCFLGAIFAGTPTLASRTALVLDPKGAIVEQYTADASQRAFANLFGEKVHETQLRDVLHALESAAKDPRIERLVIIPDDISSVGYSSLREIGAAIEQFKTSGKDVIAVSNGMSQAQYYLAAHADQILLHPQGAVFLEGLGRYRSYYKDALDKLGVDVHLFRVGEYKSAGEPFILNHASDEAREADLYWMNDLWSGFLADIGQARELDPHTLKEGVDNFGDLVKASHGDLATLALNAKLVDELATRDEARNLLIAKGEKDEHNHTFRQIDLKSYAALIDREVLPPLGDKIAVVVAEGEIIAGDQPPGTIGSDSTAQLIRNAREDEHVKALVLRVNSPGGEVFASEVIRREVELTKAAGKPVVVSMGDVAASGGYWISMDADEIWAQPSTITGSIGIFGLFMTIPNTLAKIGIHTDGIATAPLAHALDLRLPLDPKMGEMIQTVINKGYQDFINRVATARNKTPAEIDAVARGRVWSGAQAKERGLVDQLGGLSDAIAAAAARAKMPADYKVVYEEKDVSPWERLMLNLTGNASVRFGNIDLGLPQRLLASTDVRQTLKLFNTMDGNKIGVFAYCFCEIK